MRHICLHILTLLLAACASTAQQSNSSKPVWNYRADTFITVNGQTFEGMGVTKLDGNELVIAIDSPLKMDRLKISTCARQDVFFGLDNHFDYHYVPSPIELAGMCNLMIASYSHGALTSWAYLAFRQTETLPSHAWCNGAGWTFAGVSVCQTLNGLEQQISFKTKVAYSAEPACHATTTDDQTFTYLPATGFCRMTFVGLDQQGKKIYHRNVTLGYADVLIRE